VATSFDSIDWERMQGELFDDENEWYQREQALALDRTTVHVRPWPNIGQPSMSIGLGGRRAIVGAVVGSAPLGVRLRRGARWKCAGCMGNVWRAGCAVRPCENGAALPRFWLCCTMHRCSHSSQRRSRAMAGFVARTQHLMFSVLSALRSLLRLIVGRRLTVASLGDASSWTTALA